ncbi:MAG: hypothetical protein AMXMBFR33_17760 [Candidatus Xenobia bacterium]
MFDRRPAARGQFRKSVQLDYKTLEAMRLHHPAWNFLRADLAPLVTSFLHRVFLVPNVRSLPLSELKEKLEDELFHLRQVHGEDKFPRSATAYLDDWAQDDKGWLRKFYPPGQDEPSYDLTPASEKAIAWLAQLLERHFVGTESRLMLVFALLREMIEGTETDPKARVQELRNKQAELQLEIDRLHQGDLDLLDDTGLKDRFLQLSATARQLLGDFREVEENFRKLDRSVRERIALWDGTKGALLDEILGERDAITDSDQGRSFQAFWDFLMSQSKQEELGSMLEKVLALPAVASLKPDARLRRVHYDWLTAGEHTQRMVATLSQQLRRFLDDQAFMENRRILEILKSIEGQALKVRERPPEGEFMTLDESRVDIELPMDRPLYTPPLKVKLTSDQLEAGEAQLDTRRLFDQIVVDRAKLADRVRTALGSRTQVSLGELIQEHPLEHGLAELVGYLWLATEENRAMIDESGLEKISWTDAEQKRKMAELPRVIFVRSMCSR